MVTIYLDCRGKLRAKGGTRERRALVLTMLRATTDEARKVLDEKPKKRRKRKR